MQIIFWNTLFTAHQPSLFGRLMFLDHAYEGIDYFCLNEATLDLEKMFNKSGWQTFYVANTSTRGVLIASRRPLRNKRHYLLSAVERAGGPNSNHLMMVEAHHRNQNFTLAVTHLTYWRLREITRRRLERQKLAKIIPKNRTILGGDFNTILLHFAKWDIERVGYVSKLKGKTWRWRLKDTFMRTPLKLQLDYVFSTYDLQNSVKARLLKEQSISDHLPILTTLN